MLDELRPLPAAAVFLWLQRRWFPMAGGDFEDRVARLQHTVQLIDRLQRLLQGVEQWCGPQQETPLAALLQEVVDDLVDLSSESQCIRLELLDWFVWENQCGRSMGIISVGRDHRQVTTVRDLLTAELDEQPDE